MAAGCFPLLPDRLSYPEIVGLRDYAEAEDFFYDGSRDHLIIRLQELLIRCASGSLWNEHSQRYIREQIAPLRWPRLAQRYDRGLELLLKGDN